MLIENQSVDEHDGDRTENVTDSIGYNPNVEGLKISKCVWIFLFFSTCFLKVLVQKIVTKTRIFARMAIVTSIARKIKEVSV